MWTVVQIYKEFNVISASMYFLYFPNFLQWACYTPPSLFLWNILNIVKSTEEITKSYVLPHSDWKTVISGHYYTIFIIRKTHVVFSKWMVNPASLGWGGRALDSLLHTQGSLGWPHPPTLGLSFSSETSDLEQCVSFLASQVFCFWVCSWQWQRECSPGVRHLRSAQTTWVWILALPRRASYWTSLYLIFPICKWR